MNFRLARACIALMALTALILPACGGGSGGGGPTLPPGPQLTQLAIDTTTGTVTVTSPASHLVVTGTASPGGANDSIVDLTVLSNYPRLLFNLKAVLTALSDGVASADGQFQGDPYAFYGPNALAPGASATASFALTGLTGTTFTMTIDWLDHPMVFVPGDNNGGGPIMAMDSSGSGQSHPIDTDGFSFYGGGNAGNQGGVVSLDGRYLYLSPRNQPGIVMVDLTTMLPTMGADLSGGTIAFDATGSVGFLDDVQMSPDGRFLYALLTVGGHSYSGEGGVVDGYGGAALQAATTDVHLVKLDRVAFTEVGRATLATGLPQVGNDSQVGKGLSLSPSGARAAACIRNGGQVYVVETAGMTLFDADLGTAGIQPFDTTSIGTQPRRTAFRDENFLCVGLAGDNGGAGNDGTLLTADLTTRLLGTIAPAVDYAGYTYHYMGAFWRHPDGRLFVFHPFDNSYPALAAYDFGTSTWTTAFLSASGYDFDGATFSPDGLRIYVYVQSGLPGAGTVDSLATIDPTTLMILPTEADPARDETPTLGDGYGHTCIVTPF